MINELIGGCGKSTLLKVLLGQLYPESGNVNALGRPPGIFSLLLIVIINY